MKKIKKLRGIPTHVFEQIPSTNQILWDYLAQGQKAPMIAIAARQRAGRGQWGRIWQSELGGLYLSLILPLNLHIDCAPHLTLLSGVGIAQILQKYQIPVQLKWPNDLILNRRKLGGIKTETRSQNNQLTYAVIGIGVNWSNSVPNVGITLESYCREQSIDTITSIDQLTSLILEGLLSTYQNYLDKGIEPILSDYWQMFAYRGKLMPVAGTQGKIIGITPQGELKVSLTSTGAKTELCLAPGEISLGYDSDIAPTQN